MANAFSTFSMTDSMQKQSQARAGSTSALFRGSSTATARMPVMATKPNGNMSPDLGPSPLSPAAPGTPKITENIDTQYFNKEKTRQGMFSTLLGRDINLNSSVRRRNELSALIGA